MFVISKALSNLSSSDLNHLNESRKNIKKKYKIMSFQHDRIRVYNYSLEIKT